MGVLSAALALLLRAAPAAAEDGWSLSLGSLVEQAKSIGRRPAAARKMDSGMADALVPVLQGILSRAQALGIDLFRRQSLYLDTQFFGALEPMRPELASWLYRSDTYDWAQPDSSGESVVLSVSRRLGPALSRQQVLSLIMLLKNQLIRPAAFRASAMMGGVDPFSDPSLAYFYSGEGSRTVPADVRSLGEELMKEGRASWADPGKLCDSILIPPSEKGERPTVQNMYYQKECTCMARALREAMARRGLAPATVGLMKLVQVKDSSLMPEERKYPGNETPSHLSIPPFLASYAAKPDQVGLFKLDSVAPGLPLSARADPDPTVKPTPPDSWNFHVAAAFRVRGETYVLDPITSRTALSLSQWLEMFENPKGRLLIERLGAAR